MMYRAIMDRVIVRLCHTNDKSPLICAENRYRNRGVVLSVGPEVFGVKVGDEIIFHYFDDLPLAQKDVVAVREKSILGIVGESG